MHNCALWFTRRPMPSASLRLICFPYAGGNASAYAGWQEALGPQIEVCALQLPGRASRFSEPAPASMPALVAQLCDAIAALPPMPCAFFGHSMGALIAFETIRHMLARAMTPPRLLFASGCAAPRHRGPAKRFDLLDDAQFIAQLKTYNGTPPAILQHAELMELVLPTIRADFALVDNYACAHETRFKVPVSVLAGKDDDGIEPGQYHGWQDETDGPCELHWFSGDHFFLHSATAEVQTHVSACLAAIEQPA